jgi:PAS domain-containing protein
MKSAKKNDFIYWFLSKPKSVGTFLFLIMSAVVTIFIFSQYQIVKEKEHLEMKNILNAVNNNIENSLKNSYTTVLSLALTINDNGIPENFDYYGSQLLKSNPNISALQLAPNGIIKYIYPLKGHEKALNLNLLKTSDLKEEALKAIKNKKMYFAGPLKLKQGGIGILGRLPVYNKNKFWGFSTVIIKLETLLKVSGINAIDSSKYYFQISKQNPLTKKEEFFLPNKGNYTEKYFISPKITEGNWRLYIYSKKQNDYLSYILLFGVLGFVLSGLIGFLISILLKKPAELQAHIDHQTIKLLDTESKFKAIFDQAAIGIANVDTHSGDFVEVNKRFCKQLGYTQKEMKYMNFQSITHPEDLENDFAYLKIKRR